MTSGNGKVERDRDVPLAVRLAHDLNERAAAADAPRYYLPVGDQLQAAASAWLERHPDLNDEQAAAWLRHVESLDHAVVEIGFAPEAPGPAIIKVDSPCEITLRELDDRARALALLRTPATVEESDAAAKAAAAEAFERSQRASSSLPGPISRIGAVGRAPTTQQIVERRRRRVLADDEPDPVRHQDDEHVGAPAPRRKPRRRRVLPGDGA